MSAILDFEIINFREYDCSKEPGLPNCQIVELFLTVDTLRKLQNGVNIDESIDRCEILYFYINLKKYFQWDGHFEKWCYYYSLWKNEFEIGKEWTFF